MAARSSIRRLPVETGQGAGIGGGRGVRGMDRRESSELRDIELQVRAEELQVLGELEEDVRQLTECERLRHQLAEIMEQSQSVLAQIEDYNARLQHLLAHPAMRTEQDVIGRCQRQVAMASSKLHRMRGRREEVTSKLDEAEQLAGSVRSLGTSRDTTVCHALNGLANTKLLYAAGEQLKPEMFEQLRAVTLATQDLSVSHSNARARMELCLRGAKRLMADLEPVDLSFVSEQVAQLEERLAD